VEDGFQGVDLLFALLAGSRVVVLGVTSFRWFSLFFALFFSFYSDVCLLSVSFVC